MFISYMVYLYYMYMIIIIYTSHTHIYYITVIHSINIPYIWYNYDILIVLLYQEAMYIYTTLYTIKKKYTCTDRELNPQPLGRARRAMPLDLSQSTQMQMYKYSIRPRIYGIIIPHMVKILRSSCIIIPCEYHTNTTGIPPIV